MLIFKSFVKVNVCIILLQHRCITVVFDAVYSRHIPYAVLYTVTVLMCVQRQSIFGKLVQ